MDLVQLERFITVADTGSLRKAAHRLGVSQPTLTWSIQQLEASLRTRLLERHGRGSRLTDAGRALLPHAQLLINEGRRAVAVVETLQGERDPELTVAATPPFTTDLIPQALARVMSDMPRLRVNLLQGESQALIDGVRNGDLDLAFVNPRKDSDLKGLDFEKVHEERYALAARAGHPIFSKTRQIRLEHVVRWPWVMHRGTVTRDTRGTPFARAGLQMPAVRTFVASEHLLRPMILATDQLGYVAGDLIVQELREGSIRVIDLPELTVVTPAGLLARQNATYTLAMRAFCREVRILCKRGLAARKRRT